MNWLALLAVQGTLKSLLQHHSSKVLILRCSAFFIVQLSHPYMTTGKTIALTRQNFFWERLRAGGEGDDRGWDGWMASPIQWIWVWVNSGSWWWTGRPGMLQSMEWQRVGHDWATELNWTELKTEVMLNHPSIIFNCGCWVQWLLLLPDWAHDYSFVPHFL